VCRESVSDQASLPLARIRLLSDRSWLVTADEVPLPDGRLDVEAVATVNGDALTRTWAGAQYFPWSDLVAHAAHNTRLRPGDVLGSSTLNRGCLLELGPLEGDRFLGAGDTVALEAGPVGLEKPDRLAEAPPDGRDRETANLLDAGLVRRGRLRRPGLRGDVVVGALRAGNVAREDRLDLCSLADQHGDPARQRGDGDQLSATTLGLGLAPKRA
jgi:hypothetical protein